MTKDISRPVIEVLAEEISAREELDPHFFDDLKTDSTKKALGLGIDPETVKKLFRHE